MTCNHLRLHLAHSDSVQDFLPPSSRRALKKKAMAMPAAQSASHSSAEGIKTVNVRIKGTVQGVFYRDWTVEAAQKLGLNGWVRNCRDGSVEALFSGKPSVVDDMVESCRSGPPAAVVTGLNVQPSAESISAGFQKRPTA